MMEFHAFLLSLKSVPWDFSEEIRKKSPQDGLATLNPRLRERWFLSSGPGKNALYTQHPCVINIVVVE
jgi:hypothetical protein